MIHQYQTGMRLKFCHDKNWALPLTPTQEQPLPFLH